MSDLDAFRAEIRAWLEENCPAEMRQPARDEDDVCWGGRNFKFKNDTEWPIYIVANYSTQKCTVEIYGMLLPDGVSIDLESTVTRTIDPPSDTKYVQNTKLAAGTQETTIKKRTGYVVETYQIWYQNGKEVDRKLLCTSTYKAYQETVEYN